MLLWGFLVKSLIVTATVIHISPTPFNAASVVITLLVSGYFAFHAILIENIFELLIFLTLSIGTTLWLGLFPHGYLLALVLAAAFSFDFLAILLIFFLPSSVCSSFGYYHFRLSAAAKVQAMYHSYQSLLTLLKLDTFVTLLLLVRSLEHFGWSGLLLDVLCLSSFVWQALCWRSLRREDGEKLHLLLSLWWLQPAMAVYLLVVLPKGWAHSPFLVLCLCVVLVRVLCLLGGFQVSANFHKGLLELHERADSMRMELRSPFTLSIGPERSGDAELRPNNFMLVIEPEPSIQCSSRYYDTFSSHD